MFAGHSRDMTESYRRSGEYPSTPRTATATRPTRRRLRTSPRSRSRRRPGTTVWPGSGGAAGHSGRRTATAASVRGCRSPPPSRPGTGAGPGGRSPCSPPWRSPRRSSAAAPPPPSAVHRHRFQRHRQQPVVSGTTVSQSSKGTVAGVAKAVSPDASSRSAPPRTPGESTGSGVIITSDGEIITNNHVISGASDDQGAAEQRQDVHREGRRHRRRQGPRADQAGGRERPEDGHARRLRRRQGRRPGRRDRLPRGPDRHRHQRHRLRAQPRRHRRQGQENGQEQGQQRRRQWPWPFEFGGQQFNGDTGSSTTTYKASRPTPRSTPATPAAR